MPGGRPRTPVDKAKITGADKQQPGRFEGRFNPDLPPLGDPPACFLDEPGMIRAWEKFKFEIPWLTESDRMIVTLAASLRTAFEEDPRSFPVGRMIQLRQCISQMGGTPTDRSKVSGGNTDGNGGTDPYFDD